MRIFVFLVFVIALLARPGWAEVDDPAARAARADLLFPEAAGWTRVAGLPKAKGLDARLLDRLAAAAFPDEPRDNDGDTCSSRFRMRTDPGIAAGIRQGDLFGTGRRDMVYADLMICNEGALTIVWRDVDGPNPPVASVFWGRAMRIEKAAAPRLTYVREACCAALDDFYMIRRLADREPEGLDFHHGALRVVHAAVTLEAPAGAKAAAARLTVRKPVTLLPEPDDAPPPPAPADADDELPSPGTYATYPAGTGLDQVMSYVDGRGRAWSLVIGPLARVSDDELALNLGWIRRP